MAQFVPVRAESQVAAVAALAHEIWYEYYVPLIGRAQVDYMVAKFQNAQAMAAHIDAGYEYFLVQDGWVGVRDSVRDSAVVQDSDSVGVLDDQSALQREAPAPRNIGYIAVQEQPGSRMFISKLYLHHSARGSGTGRRCMEFIERLARHRGIAVLWLTVNKGNPAVQAYQRLGFRIVEDLVMDIGGGFVMDDFRMEKPLAAGVWVGRGRQYRRSPRGA